MSNEILKKGLTKQKGEFVNWFVISFPNKNWVIRTSNTSILESVCIELAKATGTKRVSKINLNLTVKKLESLYKENKNPVPIRYKNHSVPESNYPLLERKPMPGR